MTTIFQGAIEKKDQQNSTKKGRQKAKKKIIDFKKQRKSIKKNKEWNLSMSHSLTKSKTIEF